MVVGRDPILVIADDINSDWLKFLPDEQNPGKTYRESELEITEQALAELQAERSTLPNIVKRLLTLIPRKE
ncbi:MAG: hypothetical protein ACXABD_22330 [Candidatus Thorarchaeota archaeon]|jgi:hypothetical protein